MGSELSPKEYDQFHGVAVHYGAHYTKSTYYALFRAVVQKLRETQARRVLEVGCGSGMLAQMILDELPGIDYRGFDFSRTGVERAGRRTGEADRFFVGDARSAAPYREDYDTVVCTEVLEHIEDDLGAVRQWRPGVTCVCSVPNFPYSGHVRFFRNESEVRARYGDSLEIANIRRIAKPVLAETTWGDYLRRLRWSRNDPRKMLGLLGINRFEYLAGWFMFDGRRRAN